MRAFSCVHKIPNTLLCQWILGCISTRCQLACTEISETSYIHRSVWISFPGMLPICLRIDARPIEKAKIEKKNVLRIIPTCQLCCDCSMVLWELFVLLLFPLSLARPTSSCQEGASFCLNGIKETGRFVFFQSCLGLDQTRSSVFFSWGPKCLVFRRGFLRVGVGCT